MLSTRSLLIYGLLVAIAGSAILYARAPRAWSISASRLVYLQGALRELDAGGPPLWGELPDAVVGSTRSPDGSYVGPTSPGDDQGIFFYVPSWRMSWA